MPPTMDRLDDEVAADQTDSFTGLLGRLNDQSVRPGKHFDAYADVPWDEHPIDPADPRWELDGLDPLGQTAWYQSQPQEVRAGHRPARHRQQDAGRLLLRGRAQARPARARHHPAGRFTRAAVRVPRGHRGGAALPDVPGVRRPRRPRHGAEAPARGRGRVAAASSGWRGASRSCSSSSCSAARIRSTTCSARPSASKDEGAAPAARADHADPRHRGGPPPLLRSPLAEARVPEARARAPHDPLLRRAADPRRDGRADAEAVPGARGASTASRRTCSARPTTTTPSSRSGAAVSMRKVRVLCRDLGLINPLSKRLWKANKIWQDD